MSYFFIKKFLNLISVVVELSYFLTKLFYHNLIMLLQMEDEAAILKEFHSQQEIYEQLPPEDSEILKKHFSSTEYVRNI